MRFLPIPIGPQRVRQVVRVALWSGPAMARSSRARKFASPLRVANSRVSGHSLPGCPSFGGPLTVGLVREEQAECFVASRALVMREQVRSALARQELKPSPAGLSVLRRPAGSRSGSEQRKYGLHLSPGLCQSAVLLGLAASVALVRSVNLAA